MSLFWICLLFNYTEISFGRTNVFGLLILLMVAYGPFVPDTVGVLLGRNPDDSPELPGPLECQNLATGT
jgi:hypothetical protein